MRDTSLQAYKQIVASGLINGIRLQVFDAIYKHGPITMNEIFIEHLPTISQHTQTPRYAELEEMGVIAAVGKRVDRHTNVECITWDITGKSPTKLKPRLSKPDQIARVKKLLNDIAWHVQHEVKIDFDDFKVKGKKLIEELETGREVE